MGLGTNHVTTTTAANFIPAIWSREIKRATEFNLVMAKLVKRMDAEVSQKGNTVYIPDLSNLTAATKAASTAVNFQAITENKTTLSIDTHIYAAFFVEDIAKAQSQYSLQSEYTSKAGYALSKQIDTSLMNLYSSITQEVGAGGTPVQDSALLQAINYLDEADAPGEDRNIVINPDAKMDIMNIDKFVRADVLPLIVAKSSPIITGKLAGNVYGANVFVTNNVQSNTDGTVYKANLIFHKEAFILAMQKNIRTQTQYFLEYLGNGVVADALYGKTAYRSEFGVILKT
jgi:hypothetical protein